MIDHLLHQQPGDAPPAGRRLHIEANQGALVVLLSLLADHKSRHSDKGVGMESAKRGIGPRATSDGGEPF